MKTSLNHNNNNHSFLSKLSDEMIISKLSLATNEQNDKMLIKILYDRYYEDEVQFACFCGLPLPDAKKQVNEIFLDIFKNKSSLKRPPSFSVWIGKMVVKKTKEWRKTRKITNEPNNISFRENTSQNEENEEIIFEKKLFELAKEAQEKIKKDKHDKHIMSAKKKIKAVVNNLPNHLRAVVLLRTFGNQNVIQISETLKITPQQAILRLKQGVEMAQKLMSPVQEKKQQVVQNEVKQMPSENNDTNSFYQNYQGETVANTATF